MAKKVLPLLGPAVAVLSETHFDVYDDYRYLVELELGENGMNEDGVDVDDAGVNGVDEDDVDQAGVNEDGVDEDDVEDDDAKDALRLDQIANQIRCEKDRLDGLLTSQGSETEHEMPPMPRVARGERQEPHCTPW